MPTAVVQQKAADVEKAKSKATVVEKAKAPVMKTKATVVNKAKAPTATIVKNKIAKPCECLRCRFNMSYERTVLH